MTLSKQDQPNLSSLSLPGVGKQIAKHLARLAIFSIPDLLLHLPLRYQDRTRLQSIRDVIPGQEAVIEGVITQVFPPIKGRTKLLCELFDGKGKIYLRYFHILPFQTAILKPKTRLRCFGEVKLGNRGLEMFHPEFKVVTEGKTILIDEHLTPIYPTTEGLNQYVLRKITDHALLQLDQEVFFRELIPDAILQTLSFPTLRQALRFLHRPTQGVSLEDLLERKTLPQKRIVFEELLAHRLSLLHIKQTFQAKTGMALLPKNKITSLFLKQLPFKLTKAQSRVVDEMSADLAKSYPMLRLVQGDVGSGKTVVAALAMLRALENGYQSAMMAPTELLAEQHYRVFKKWLEPLGIKVVYLSGHLKARDRKLGLKQIAEGEAQIILGTHALFQEAVQFSNLALVIVDEQHRFGVHQRALFREKGMQSDYYPHQLVMTATPIPRTLAMSFYADLDCSIIDELPPGRTPITTSVIADTRRDEIVSRIREACESGRQAYWVCPLIEESELISCQAATKTADYLQAALPSLHIGLIHGRMSSLEKETVMRAFQENEIHLLVATTVIEVGVDVANASVMVIENSERLGLSQLHQLRGRVGRGAAASHCILLYQSPLSALAKERLGVMRDTTDGFKIAQRDLELRGPGEVLGTRQTGDLVFRVADLVRDSDLLPEIHQVADKILRDHPEVVPPLVTRWLGRGEDYGKV